MKLHAAGAARGATTTGAQAHTKHLYCGKPTTIQATA